MMMGRHRSLTLTAAALLLLVAGIWVSMHRSSQQSNLGGGSLFTDLTGALGDIGEIRLSKGDGSRTTLRRTDAGWRVVVRAFPADPARVRELLLGLSSMKIIEPKTSDPANYPKLGVEAPDTPTATSTLVEAVAGERTWGLIVGKNAEGRAQYVRKPDSAASALVEPSISADPDQKRWIDRLLTDLRGSEVQQIAVKPAKGPAYELTRAQRGETDLALSPVPRGRKPASSMSINGQADTLTAFNFDDVRPVSADAPAALDRATFHTFDGQVIEFSGYKDDDKAYVRIAARRDPELAARFAPKEEPKEEAKAEAANPAADAKADAKPESRPDQTTERLAARVEGVEFEIPLYKYDSLFKPLEELLEDRS